MEKLNLKLSLQQNWSLNTLLAESLRPAGSDEVSVFIYEQILFAFSLLSMFYSYLPSLVFFRSLFIPSVIVYCLFVGSSQQSWYNVFEIFLVCALAAFLVIVVPAPVVKWHIKKIVIRKISVLSSYRQQLHYWLMINYIEFRNFGQFASVPLDSRAHVFLHFCLYENCKACQVTLGLIIFPRKQKFRPKIW